MISKKITMLLGMVYLLVFAVQVRAEWTPIGPNVNVDTYASVYDKNMAVSPSGDIYITWGEAGNVYVKKWDGTSWTLIGSALDTQSGNYAGYPDIAISDSGVIYVAWLESGYPTAYQSSVYVKKWTGTDWEPVGLRLNPGARNTSARYPLIAVLGETPFACWYETSSTVYDDSALHVRVFDGYSWNPVGEALATGGSYGYADMEFVNNILYVGYSKVVSSNTLLAVDRFVNGSWESLGTLNYSPTSGATFASITEYAGQPVVSWHEGWSQDAKVYVKTYNGTQWEFMGNAPLNVEPDENAGYINVCAANGTLLAAWQESGQGMVWQWTGSTWVRLGGTFPMDPEKAVGLPSVMLREGVPFVCWHEHDGATFQLHAAEYVEPQWTENFLYSDDQPAAQAGDQPPGWYDESDDGGLNAQIGYAATDGLATVSVVTGESWGKVLSYTQTVDLSAVNELKVVIKEISSGAAVRIGVFHPNDPPGSWEEYYTDYIQSAGAQSIDIAALTGWSGTEVLGVVLLVNGDGGSATFETVAIQTSAPQATPTPYVTPTITPTFTATPTATPSPTPDPDDAWRDLFTGIVNHTVSGWLDETNNRTMDVGYEYALEFSKANLIRRPEGTWGKTLSPLQSCDVDVYPRVEVKVDAVSPDAQWRLGLLDPDPPYNQWYLNDYTQATGVFNMDYRAITGLSGSNQFQLFIAIEGECGEWVKVDYIRIYKAGMWDEQFKYSDDNPASSPGTQCPGWYDESDDTSFNAQIAYDTTDGLAGVSTVSGETWGKVLSFSQSVDLSSTRNLEVVIASIPSGSAKIAVFSQDGGWDEHILSGSITQAGVFGFDIPSTTGWSGTKNMGVELIVEGSNGQVLFDSVRLHNEGTPTPTPSATPTPTPSNVYFTHFSGTPNVQPTDWIDESDSSAFDLEIAYSFEDSFAALTRTADGTWGKVQSSVITCDVGTHGYIELAVASLTSDTSWKLGIQEEEGAYSYYDLSGSQAGTGTYEVNYASSTGWTGMHTFRVQLVVEGGNGKNIVLDWLRVGGDETVMGSSVHGAFVSFTSTYTPTPTVTPTQSPLPTSTPAATQAVDTATPSHTPTMTPTPYVAADTVLPYPNPARGKVNFAYTVAGPGKVKIDIYKLTGERVASIVEQVNGGAGQTLSTAWEAADVAPGIYFCRIVITDGSGKVVLDQKKKVALIQ